MPTHLFFPTLDPNNMISTSVSGEIVLSEVVCKPILTFTTSTSSKETDLSEKAKLQLDCEFATESLSLLVEGVRLVTHQMRHCHHLHENESFASPTSTNAQPIRERTFSNESQSSIGSSVVIDEDKHISELCYCLGTAIGADLMCLSQTAHMLREHSQLASQEASLLTDDINNANQRIQDIEDRFRKAEKVIYKLRHEIDHLENHLVKVTAERNILAKEIKCIRKQTVQNCHVPCEMQGAYSDMEEQVRCALIIHEHQLAKATKGKRFDSWDNASDETLCCSSPSKEEDGTIIATKQTDQALDTAAQCDESTSTEMFVLLGNGDDDEYNHNKINHQQVNDPPKCHHVTPQSNVKSKKPCMPSIGFGAGLSAMAYKSNISKKTSLNKPQKKQDGKVIDEKTSSVSSEETLISGESLGISNPTITSKAKATSESNLFMLTTNNEEKKDGKTTLSAGFNADMKGDTPITKEINSDSQGAIRDLRFASSQFAKLVSSRVNEQFRTNTMFRPLGGGGSHLEEIVHSTPQTQKQTFLSVSPVSVDTSIGEDCP
jgi:archaellum component FlaC